VLLFCHILDLYCCFHTYLYLSSHTISSHSPSYRNPCGIYICTKDFNIFLVSNRNNQDIYKTLICQLIPCLICDVYQKHRHRSHQSCHPTMCDPSNILININYSSRLKSDTLSINSSSVCSACLDPSTQMLISFP